MQEYFMGIDDGGYDKHTFAMTAMDGSGNIIAFYFGHDRDAFDKVVKETADKFGILEEEIMYEIN